MPTPQEIEAQIAAIDAKLNSGTTVIQSGNDRVQRDLPELRRQRERLTSQLGEASGLRRVRRIYTTSCKGL